MRLIATKPALAVLWLSLILFAAGLIACWVLLREPWLGIHMRADGARDAVVVVRVAPVLEGVIPVGAQLLRLVSPDGKSINLRSTDLIEEPDFFHTYSEMDDFFGRQTALSALLHAGALSVVWRESPDGAEKQALITPGVRPFLSLSAAFWFPLSIGFFALLTAAWVLVLRPDHWGARLFALTGLAFPVFTTSAAIYGSRELALPGELFRLLSSLNHAGANLFGSALAGLLLLYPQPLVRPRVVLALFGVFGLWWLADTLRWAPDQNWGSRLPIMLQMLMAIGFGILQWHRSRRNPLDRAALRWFTLSCLVGCSLFILTVYVPSMLGWFAPLPQAYAFGFFFIMYLGIALGLGKYRLFDLDEWAYRVWVWLVGVLAVVAIDAAFLYAGASQNLSLGATLLLCGAVYFPFRQWLWRRLLKGREIRIELLLPELSRIAFLASADAQLAAWHALLRQRFDPLEITSCEALVLQAEIQEEGLLLRMPACAGIAACSLRHAGSGARLFSSRDVQFAAGLCQLMDAMMSGRTRYEQGVMQERLRIGRDLHDNIGARLLKMIHQLRGTPTAEVAREAMKDLRTSIAALDGQPVPLLVALADWRAEAEARCELIGCHLQWQQSQVMSPAPALPPRTKAMLEAIQRELITNALKHAKPSHISTVIGLTKEKLTFSIANDGAVTEPTGWKDGYGLRNMRSRLGEIGGELEIESVAEQVRLTIRVELT